MIECITQTYSDFMWQYVVFAPLAYAIYQWYRVYLSFECFKTNINVLSLSCLM